MFGLHCSKFLDPLRSRPTRSEKMLAEEPAERPLASGSQAGLQRGKSTASDASQPAKKSREQSGVLRNESNASASGYGGATEPQRGNSSASFGGHGRAEQPAGLQGVKSTSSTAGGYAAEQPPGVQLGGFWQAAWLPGYQIDRNLRLLKKLPLHHRV